MIRISTLQYNMLKMFASEGPDFFMSIADAQKFDQRPFRSMLIQKWIAYRPSKGFHLTREGKNAYFDFEEHNITRKNPSLPLTAYFDPTAYGLKAPKKRPALRVVA